MGVAGGSSPVVHICVVRIRGVAGWSFEHIRSSGRHRGGFGKRRVKVERHSLESWVCPAVGGTRRRWIGVGDRVVVAGGVGIGIIRRFVSKVDRRNG